MSSHFNNGETFQVIVYNQWGSTNSSTATLFVYDPQICQQPNNVSAAVGSTTNFHVNASGTFPLSYQWYFQGIPMTNGPNVTAWTPNSCDQQCANKQQRFLQCVGH
jgi:hypothetical protein